MFRILIDGIEDSYAETCSEFMNESAVIEQRRGGSLEVEEKLDGNVTRAPITLTRGPAGRIGGKKSSTMAPKRHRATPRSSSSRRTAPCWPESTSRELGRPVTR